MSQYPSNFGQQPQYPQGGSPQYGAAQPPGYGQAPYGQAPYGQSPPPKKGPNVLMILGIIFGVGGAFFLCCCGGCFGLGYFGLSMKADAVAQQLESNDVIQEHIGTGVEASFNFSQTANDESPESEAYTVTGSKGSGVVVVETSDDIENLEIYYGELRKDGQTFDLGY